MSSLRKRRSLFAATSLTALIFLVGTLFLYPHIVMANYNVISVNYVEREESHSKSGAEILYSKSAETPTRDDDPSITPDSSPSPTHYPTFEPFASTVPSNMPSIVPSNQPSLKDSVQTESVSELLSVVPSSLRITDLSPNPSLEPSMSTSPAPSNRPSFLPSEKLLTKLSEILESDSKAPPVEPNESSPSAKTSPRVTSNERASKPPIIAPSASPSTMLIAFPTYRPTKVPSHIPTVMPSSQPSSSQYPSLVPSQSTTARVQPSKLPSAFPSKLSLSLQSYLPSSLPSSVPSVSPSALPDDVPSELPSALPSRFPSTSPSKEPSASPSNEPSPLPTQSPTQYFGETTFFVIADTPYTEEDHLGMPALIDSISADATFAVHLGDILDSKTDPCNNETLHRFAAYLENSPVPFFLVTGDNEYTDCQDPDAAMALWRQNFVRFDQRHWNHTLDVTTMDDRPESFSFVHQGTLFIGLNIVGLPRRDKDEWKERLSTQADWTVDLIEKHRYGDNAIGAIVIMAHAELRSNDHRHFLDPLVDYIDDDLDNEIPIMYVHGDLHSWKYEKEYKDQSSFVRVRKNAGVDDPAAQIITHPTLEGVERSREIDGADFFHVFRFRDEEEN